MSHFSPRVKQKWIPSSGAHFVSSAVIMCYIRVAFLFSLYFCNLRRLFTFSIVRGMILLCSLRTVHYIIKKQVKYLCNVKFNFNYTTLNNKNRRFRQTLSVPSAPIDKDVGNFKYHRDTKRQKPHRGRTEKESATFSNQDIKGPIFPEGRAKSLKGGQLLAAQFNQKIKHRGPSHTPT